jgi:hypothetical protein
MTDDFSLFQDQADGDPVDPDIALITAYLARELSIVQIAAVEDRLANDTAFREKTLPILEAWALPAALPALVTPALTREEVEAGWQRYVGDHAELDAHEGPRLVVQGAQPKRRKISMTRIAAGVAAVLLPVITLAQITVYVAKKPEVPGHSVAKQLVAPFVEAPAAPVAPPPANPLKSPVDVPVGRQLDKGKTTVQRMTPAEVTVADVPAASITPAAPAMTRIAPAPQPAERRYNPDRTRIAGFATKHLPEVIRGDTNATYIVMVLDASDNYVWATHGVGSLQISIAGDKRTSAERGEANRAGSLEYTGMMPGVPGQRVSGGGGGVARGGGGGGGGGGAVAFSRARGGAGTPDSGMILRADTTVVRLNDSTTRQSVAQTRLLVPDSAMMARAQQPVASGRVGGAGGGGFARAGAPAGFADSTGAYTLGFAIVINGQIANLNTAAGLQETGNGESGIQGLKSSSLTMGEQYFFAPGQLTPQPIRIYVVHLAAGTNWKGR